MVVLDLVVMWRGWWWCSSSVADGGVDSRALLQSAEPGGRGGSMGLPEDGKAGFVILVLDYQCDFGCWFMVLLIYDSAMNRTMV